MNKRSMNKTARSCLRIGDNVQITVKSGTQIGFIKRKIGKLNPGDIIMVEVGKVLEPGWDK